MSNVSGASPYLVPNPEGLVWERVKVPYFLKGAEAQAYVDEYIADLASLSADASNDPSKDWMTPNVTDYSAVPAEQLPFSLRAEKPSLFIYTQAFYQWVAAGADKAAKDKLDEITKLNDQLKQLNDVISMLGEVDALVEDGAPWWDGDLDYDPMSVTEAMFKVGTRRGIKGPWIFLDDEDAVFTNGFVITYDAKMRQAGLDPDKEEFNLNPSSKTTGGSISAIVRSLQAEATKKGNEIQRMMTESSNKISFQSAVNEGLKSFGDRWYQMAQQTSTIA